jgi:aspartyl-tRNA(Asn)/glutamyl-tRNA(Gln) amidotransferase subunit B
MDDVSELNDVVAKVIEENPKAVEDYKCGKKNALAFLIGQTMKATKGKANPKILTEILKEKITGLK